MPHDTGPYGYPVKPFNPGKHALQEMSEALDRREQHAEWMKAHPGEMMPESHWEQSAGDWEAIERGQNLLGAMTFEAGDSLCPKKR